MSDADLIQDDGDVVGGVSSPQSPLRIAVSRGEGQVNDEVVRPLGLLLTEVPAHANERVT